MLLPEKLIIGGLNISTIWLFFAVGLVYGCFVYWYEGRKDGFIGDRLFDLIFSVVLSGALSYYFLQRFLLRQTIFFPNSVFLKYDNLFLSFVFPLMLMLLPIRFLTLRWKWSTFRILDILAVSLMHLFVFVSLGLFLTKGNISALLVLLGFISLYILVFRYRGYRYFSGLVFSIFLILIAIITLLFYRRAGYLLFCFVLFTMSFVTLYFRLKRLMKVNRQLPKQLLESLKTSLLHKEKQLDKEQKLLIEEDAFMKEGRATSNAEVMDEVSLEDSAKEISDLKLISIQNVQIQVKKALAKMKLGSYGICEVCGEPIDKARLNAYPEATKCLECAQDDE